MSAAQTPWYGAGSSFGLSTAEAYERCLGPAIFTPWARDLVELAGPVLGERVLDVACGTGVVARAVGSRVGAAGKVVGLDLNAGMLEVARSLPWTAPAPVESWVAAYRTTRSVEANVTPREQTNSRATVDVSITAVDAQDAGTITKTFEGSWNLVLLDNTWRLDTASIVETTASPTRSPVATATSTVTRASASLQPRLTATLTPTRAPVIVPYYGGGGCGSRGGPGYRLPSGKCASWRDAGR